jgi:hypothetical protein
MTEEVEFRNPKPRVVSLDLELSTLASATRGAQLLADLQTRRGLMDEHMEEAAPMCVFSILALVEGRIEQLRRVVRSEENPANIWATHNEVAVPESLGDFEGDIILFSWNTLRVPLVICSPSRMGTKTETPRKPKTKSRKAKTTKGATPVSSTPQSRESKEPSASASEPVS